MRQLCILLPAVLTAAAACSGYGPEEVEIIKLGGRPKALTIEASASACCFDIISNVPYEARIIQGGNWLSFADGGDKAIGEGNGMLELEANANTGIKRTAKIVLSYSTRSDTLRVYQSCLEEFEEKVELSSTACTIAPEGGSVELAVTSNVLPHLLVARAYSDRILDLKFEKGVLSFRVEENRSHNPLNSKVSLSFVNGWEQTQSADLTVYQNFLE